MQEQLTPLLKNILEKNIDCQNNTNTLEKYYQLFDSKKYLGNGFENIYSDIKENYNLDLQSLKYRHNNQDEQKIYTDLILAVINETDAKKKIKLMPLIIYLDSDRIFYNYLFKIKYFDNFVYDIKDFFTGTIASSGVKVGNVEKLSPYHQEKEHFEDYQNGIENFNFKQIYSFVEAVEREVLYEFDLYVDFLVFITYKYFFDDLVTIANNKKDMFEIIYLTHILNIKERLNLALKSDNCLLKFESIRKAVYFKHNNLLKKERELLKNIIVQLSKDSQIWQQFLDFYLEYPQRSTKLFEPMSNAVLHIDSQCISALIQTVKIDNYTNDSSKEALNNLILNIKDNKIKKEILEKLFDRWNNFLDNYSEHLESIVLTDIVDIVIVYIHDYVDKENIEKEVEKILNNLDEIDNFWFKNMSEQMNYFYKQLSRLSVYVFVLDKYAQKLDNMQTDFVAKVIELYFNKLDKTKLPVLKLKNQHLLSQI